MDEQKKLLLSKLTKKLWKSNWPTLQCYGCGNYSQKLTNISSYESQESILQREEYWWEYDMVEGRFVAITSCKLCKEKTCITGSYGVDCYQDQYGSEIGCEETYSIEYITPSLSPIEVPKGCPDGVMKHIKMAAQVFFISPSLAANRIRSSIDVLLTEQGVKRYYLIKGKRKRYSTHKRIEIYSKKEKEVSDLLEAVKWIGNEGSHDERLATDDLINGLEMYSKALYSIYDKSAESISKKARAINRNRGL